MLALAQITDVFVASENGALAESVRAELRRAAPALRVCVGRDEVPLRRTALPRKRARSVYAAAQRASRAAHLDCNGMRRREPCSTLGAAACRCAAVSRTPS